MKLENPDRIDLLSLDLIEVGKRARQVSAKTVDLIVQSALARDGKITVPIDVRRLKGGRFALIDGGHRIAATKVLGLTEIAAQVWSCTAEEARFMEADAILATAHITPLDLAVTLAKRKAAYEKLHPETKRGVAGALARHGVQVTEMSFADYVAKVIGITPRQSSRIIAAGEALSDQHAQALTNAPNRLVMNDLYDLAKIADPEEKDAVILRFVVGNAKSVSAARRTLKAEADGGEKLVKDPVEEAFSALSKLWSRAPMAAKKRFLLEHARDIWEAQNKGAALTNWSEAAE
jgi:ParB family transcriptional regulator, chromosome partitioning protein